MSKRFIAEVIGTAIPVLFGCGSAVLMGATLAVYVVAQLIGAVIGAGVLYLIASGKTGYDIAVNGLGQNGHGAGYLGEYSLTSALILKAVMTFLFVTVILGVTQDGALSELAGLATGLTLAAIHLVGITVRGVLDNPARSFGPALIMGGKVMADLWVFIVAPLAGGALAGILHRNGVTRAA